LPKRFDEAERASVDRAHGTKRRVDEENGSTSNAERLELRFDVRHGGGHAPTVPRGACCGKACSPSRSGVRHGAMSPTPPSASNATPSLAPYLFYEDVAAAARFLQEAFGFTLGFTSPDPAGGLAHAQLLHGSGMMMLGHAGAGGLGLVKRASSLGALHAG